jgi:hypothetical protein
MNRAIDDETTGDDMPTLGSCCVCGGLRNVGTIVMLPVRGALPGRGWGCVVCGLPADGASAVLCDACVGGYAAGDQPLRFICRGYPDSDGRMPFKDLAGAPHEHDPNVEH